MCDHAATTSLDTEMQTFYAEQGIHIASLIVTEDDELDIIPLDEEDRWEEVEYTEPVFFSDAAMAEFEVLLKQDFPAAADLPPVSAGSVDEVSPPSTVNTLEAKFERLEMLMHGLTEVRERGGGSARESAQSRGCSLPIG